MTPSEALAKIDALISGGDRPTVNEQNAFEHFTALNRLLLEVRDIARAAKPTTDSPEGNSMLYDVPDPVRAALAEIANLGAVVASSQDAFEMRRLFEKVIERAGAALRAAPQPTASPVGGQTRAVLDRTVEVLRALTKFVKVNIPSTGLAQGKVTLSLGYEGAQMMWVAQNSYEESAFNELGGLVGLCWTIAERAEAAIFALPAGGGWPNNSTPAGLADFTTRCQAYLDDHVGNGGHSDAAGGNAYELIQEAIEHCATALPLPEPAAMEVK